MSRWIHPYVRAASVAVLSCLMTAGVLVALTRAVRPPAQDRQAAPGTAWLSGESRGRAVLAAPGSAAGSVAVALGDPSTYDVTSLAKLTAVFDRQTGGLVLLDPALGTIKERKLRLMPRGEGTLVPAGTTAYLVDATALTARKVTAEGRVGDTLQLDAFTDVVGTSDGQLWLYDAASGSYGAFNGSGVPKLSRIVEPAADVALTAVGNDAVLLDRSTRRIHWLGRGATAAVAGGSGPLLLQQTDLGGFADCVTVVDGTTAQCLRPKGVARQATLPGAPVADAQVLAGAGGLVVAAASTPDILSGPWGTELAPHQRTEPSPRTLVAWSTPTAILVDDPGSRYGFTVAGAAFTSLDKFSKRTVLITPDGPKIDLDSDTQLVTKLPSAAPKPNTTKTSKPDDNPANEPPTPADDRVRTRSGRPVNVDVLANDTDPDGDTLVVVSVGTVKDGTVKPLNGSTVLYSPPATFVGTVEFRYTVADPGGLQASATVTVDVVGSDQNEVPTATDDEGETITGVPITIPVLDNDTDPEGDPLSIVLVGTPGHGAAAVTADGQLRYEPEAGYVGSDDFQYSVADGHGGRASAQVHVVVDRSDGKNRPPLAVDDRGSDIAGKRVRIAVLQNDTDPDGDSLHVVSTGNVFGVTATIVGGQSLDIIPDLRTTGVVTVPYTIEDSGGLRASAQVILVVEAPTPNRAPQAIDDNAIVASEVKIIDVVGNDVDPDGDPMTIVDFTQPPIGGSVTRGSATALRFVPTPGFTSRTSFQYTISDPDGLRSTAKVNVEVVAPTGSGPVAVDDATTISLNETARVDVLGNDSQPDGVPFGLAGPPTVRAGRAVVNPDNTISYTPPLDASGTFVLTYTIRDFYNRTASAKLVVTVLPRPPAGGGTVTPANNRPPAAIDDRSFTPFQTPVVIDVLANDSEPDGQTLGIASVSAVTGGVPTIVDVPSGPNSGSPVQVRFQPDQGFTGLASFTYLASDPLGGTASAKVVVEVGQRLKVSPIGRDDLYSMAQASTLLVDPRGNDIDPDGSSAALRIAGLVEVPAGITVSVEGNGTGLRIVSGGGGTFAFGYTVTDADGLTGAALVTVTVSGPANKPPVAADDAQSTPVGVPVTIDVLANDTDDGTNLAIQSVTQPAVGGTVAIAAGKVTFTPTGGAGTFPFTYKVVDSGGLTATATVTVTVLACTSLPPLVSNDVATTAFNTARSIDLFANDARASGTLTLGIPSSGSVALGGTPGVVVYTPANAFSGRATFTYSVTTVCNQTDTATVTVTVNPANRAPVAVNDTQGTTRNTPVLVDVLANDSDPDGDPISVVQWSNELNGTVSREPNSTLLRFTPARGFTGVGSFVYAIQDSLGVRASATVTVTVTAGANRAPTPVDDTAIATAGVPVPIDVLANDSDPDGDLLAIAQVGIVSPPGSGTAVFAFAGVPLTPQILFTPSATFTGPSTFTYTVTDGRATGTATVTVNAQGNRAPVAVADSADVVLGLATPINVLANDSDPDGDALNVVSVGAVNPPSAGTAAVVNNKVEFTGLVAGTATLTYTITDPGGLQASATLTVTISPPANQQPIAANDIGSASGPGGVATVNVVNNDRDPDGDQLTIVTTGPPNPTPVPVPDDGIGTVSVVGTDTIVFTILPTFTTPGTYTVTIPYTVSDGRGGTASATLTITVTM